MNCVGRGEAQGLLAQHPDLEPAVHLLVGHVGINGTHHSLGIGRSLQQAGHHDRIE